VLVMQAACRAMANCNNRAIPQGVALRDVGSALSRSGIEAPWLHPTGFKCALFTKLVAFIRSTVYGFLVPDPITGYSPADGAFVGRQFCFGVQVSDDETWPSVLKRRLARPLSTAVCQDTGQPKQSCAPST
jgi:hypothetical protein